MIEKIIVTGDLLRFSPQKPFFADDSIAWIVHLFSQQIKAATELDVCSVLCGDTDFFDRETFFKLSGYSEVSTENWVRMAAGLYSEVSMDYFRDCFKNCLIVTQEAGAFRGIMERLGIPYIDCYISAVRFLEDLHFAFRTNVPEIRDELRKFKISEDYIYANAERVKLYYRPKITRISVKENSLLLCGQTGVDLSLIKDGNLIGFADYENKIRHLFDQYPHVYYKPHPFAKSNDPSEMFIRSFANVEITKDNFYLLISSNAIKGVAALSSGTLIEADYFGKNIHTISHEYVHYYRGNAEFLPDDWIILTSDYFSPMFWKDVLSPVVQTHPCADFTFSDPIILRNTLRLMWGYEIGNEDGLKIDRLNAQNKQLVEKCKRLENALYSCDGFSRSNRPAHNTLEFDENVRQLKCHVKELLRPFPSIERFVRNIYFKMIK